VRKGTKTSWEKGEAICTIKHSYFPHSLLQNVYFTHYGKLSESQHTILHSISSFEMEDLEYKEVMA
jgi:hypothetical protein